MMSNPENPYAGQGPVLLDIGGDIGALVVSMPPATEGLEVEIRPAGATTHDADGHHQDHDHDAPNEPQAHGTHPHVGVVGRPSGAGIAYTLVYPAVPEGDYELYPLPDGPVAQTITITGGTVTKAVWPT